MSSGLRFLGTGASGGTPGAGRSHRMESSVLVDGGLLLDVTRDFTEQARWVPAVEAILLTHAHRDACGGLGQLRRWAAGRGVPAAPLPLYAHAETLAVLRRRFARLNHVQPFAVAADAPFAAGRWTVRAVEVPHARDCPTFAWRLDDGRTSLVYASDVAQLTPELAAACDGASLLVIDGAMWGRSLFTHLRIDRALPELCRWRAGRILLTQIGRGAPPHERLEHEVAALCPRAEPAYDGLRVALDP